ncbi:MAG: DUF4294 domain-containing protein, partial [Synergistales bacterium]|nr:DUF4294 domain-containing protein [Synergistales bacterium]
PYIRLPETEIFAFKVFKNNRQERQNYRLIRNVKVVYPYARMAGQKLTEYEEILLQTETDRERRQIMKDLEDELHREYGDQLRNLTFTQGKILIKLIDRETGDTSYDLVREMRGAFRAFFYQTFARIFGLNLKVNYDPHGEDQQIETIIRMIDQGLI